MIQKGKKTEAVMFFFELNGNKCNNHKKQLL